MEDRVELLPLGAMARVVHVPPKWLREQAAAGEIPSLDAGGTILFHRRTVEKILMSRAAGAGSAEPGGQRAE
jgi:hypothetical protein